MISRSQGYLKTQRVSVTRRFTHVSDMSKQCRNHQHGSEIRIRTQARSRPVQANWGVTLSFAIESFHGMILFGGTGPVPIRAVEKRERSRDTDIRKRSTVVKQS